jgi:putative phosphoesterase
MKYLIVSDIHGCLPTLEKVLAYFEQHGCDMLCILGDILNFGPRNGVPEGHNPPAIVERLNAYADKIVAIRGNCDSEVDQMLLKFPIMADYALLVDNGKRVFLTHGHIYNEQNMPPLAIDAFFYGHTHLKKVETNADGILICNAGSITFPKGGNPKTFAVYENGEVSLVELSEN